jgi:glycerol kinase
LRVLAIDQGTTNSKAALIDGEGRIVARSSRPMSSTYPRPGWAEQSADANWTSVRDALGEIVASTGNEGIAALAISNQRETLVVWDAGTGRPICPAILWQCRRTAEASASLRETGAEPEVMAATGLGINPLFPAGKLAWVMENVPEARGLHARGKLRAGTVDSWLLWKLTGGATYATDHSNASRTQLFDTERLEWSADLGRIFGVPVDFLPLPLGSDAEFGLTAAGVTDLLAGIPIRSVMGDSHAALYGHGVRAPGAVKATYGTGTSLMMLAPARVASAHGVSGTIAWTRGSATAYALEGNITVSAQAAEFMSGLLGLGSVESLVALAQSVDTSGGVSFVPALAGLGAPHWNDAARGLVCGMTHGTRPAHLARAALEAVALQVTEVFEAMAQDAGVRPAALLADGGASRSDFLMQLQADMLNRPVMRAETEQVGALGVAAMAFEALGHDFPISRTATEFRPTATEGEREALLTQWSDAVRRAITE